MSNEAVKVIIKYISGLFALGFGTHLLKDAHKKTREALNKEEKK